MVAVGLVFQRDDVTLKNEMLASRNEYDLGILNIQKMGRLEECRQHVLIETRAVRPRSDFSGIAMAFRSKYTVLQVTVVTHDGRNYEHILSQLQ
jgi:hypothetical protein